VILRWWAICLVVIAILVGTGVALAEPGGPRSVGQQVHSNDSANGSGGSVALSADGSAGESRSLGSRIGAFLADHGLGLAKGIGVGVLAAALIVGGAVVLGIAAAPLAVMAGAAIVAGAMYGLFSGSARFNFWEALAQATIGGISAGVGGWLAGVAGRTVLGKVAVAAVEMVGSGLANAAGYLFTVEQPTWWGALGAFGIGAGFAGSFMALGGAVSSAWQGAKGLVWVQEALESVRVPVRNLVGRVRFWLAGMDPGTEVQVALRELDAGISRGEAPVPTEGFVEPPIPAIKGPKTVAYESGTQAFDLLQTTPAKPGRVLYGDSPRFPGELKNFKPGFEIRSGVLEEDLYLVQLHADVPLHDGRSAKYWTTADQANALTSLDDFEEYLALNPDWNEYTGPRVQISVARIPKGEQITFAIGSASSQPSNQLGRELKGGAIQLLFADFDPSWIRSTRTVR
jgi:hypothetical protein